MTVEEHKVKYHQEDDHFYNHPKRGKKCPDPVYGVIIELYMA